MKRVLLISNKVMHYRVPVYNYFWRVFKEAGWEFIVRSNTLERQNPHPLEFDFKEIDFSFGKYRAEINAVAPDAVILFLHLRDRIIWPLAHWLKFKNVPVVFWTKGANLDRPDDKQSYWAYRYMHWLVDRIILYSRYEMEFIHEKHRKKVWVANNTVNFEAFPKISASREQIKREFGIPFEKVVLSVGRMGAEGGRKKIHHLIQVFNEIEAEGVGLVIVGSGMSADWIAKMNKKNTLYLGEIHDPEDIQISKIFKIADLFSIPGHIGLGLNQAFYWGLPVVTEDGFQPPEIHYLINGRNGFIVPNNNLHELKEKLMFLLENDEARRSFSENAKLDILTDATIYKMFLGFKGCIESL